MKMGVVRFKTEVSLPGGASRNNVNNHRVPGGRDEDVIHDIDLDLQAGVVRITHVNPGTGLPETIVPLSHCEFLVGELPKPKPVAVAVQLPEDEDDEPATKVETPAAKAGKR